MCLADGVDVMAMMVLAAALAMIVLQELVSMGSQFCANALVVGLGAFLLNVACDARQLTIDQVFFSLL